jgi:hypothetical protein
MRQARLTFAEYFGKVGAGMEQHETFERIHAASIQPELPSTWSAGVREQQANRATAGFKIRL